MTTINLNDTVRVRLTHHGRNVLMMYLDDLDPRPVSHDDKFTMGAVTEWQLWELAQVFGQHMFNGARSLFESHTFDVVPFALDKQLKDALTVEVRILVRVDVTDDGWEFHAAGWGDDGKVDEAQLMATVDGSTVNPSLTWVTARVSKPSVAEVEGTVDP